MCCISACRTGEKIEHSKKLTIFYKKDLEENESFVSDYYYLNTIYERKNMVGAINQRT